MKTNPTLLAPIGKRYTQVYYALYASQVVTSKADFCKSVQLHPCYFKSIADGTHYPTLTNICNLITTYSVSPDWLLLGNGNMFT